MIQSSWDDTLLDVRPSPGPSRGAVSSQSSRDKHQKRSLPGSTVRKEGRAISTQPHDARSTPRLRASQSRPDGVPHNLTEPSQVAGSGATVIFEVTDTAPEGGNDTRLWRCRRGAVLSL